MKSYRIHSAAQDWDHYGARVPLTVLWIDDCQVRLLGQPLLFVQNTLL